MDCSSSSFLRLSWTAVLSLGFRLFSIHLLTNNEVMLVDDEHFSLLKINAPLIPVLYVSCITAVLSRALFGPYWRDSLQWVWKPEVFVFFYTWSIMVFKVPPDLWFLVSVLMRIIQEDQDPCPKRKPSRGPVNSCCENRTPAVHFVSCLKNITCLL